MRRYDPELGEKLCELVADGCGLKSAAEKLGIPRRSARAWEVSVPEFTAALGAARREYLEDLAEELVALSDETAHCTDNAVVAAQRLRLDTRRWILAKLAPHKYGEALQLSGAGGRDLIPAGGSEAQRGQMLVVLSELWPEGSDSERFALADRLTARLNGGAPAQLAGGNGDGTSED